MNMLFSEDDINVMLCFLWPRQEQIIRERYGIDEPQCSIQQLAKKWGKSDATIRYWIIRANKKLLGMPDKRMKQEQEEEEDRRKECQWEEHPEMIPYGDLIRYKGEYKFTDIPYYRWQIRESRAAIHTLGDLANITPQEWRTRYGLTKHGVAAIASVLHFFGIPYDYPPPQKITGNLKKNEIEVIIDRWQTAFL